MNMAEAGQEAGGSGAVPYFLAYLKCGLSPFPVTLSKRPPLGFEWGIYRKRQATLIEVDAWDGYNIAIAAGAGSNNRVALDIDNFNFWSWLRGHPVYSVKVLGQTWVYRTGSGRGSHLWLESETEVGCSNLVLPNGVKLGEVKGEGGYLVAPPSGHETGGTYTTVYGRPDAILKVPDALKVFQHLAAAYAIFLGLGAGASGSPAQPVRVEHPYGSRILSPSLDEPWQKRLKTLPSKARRALIEPACYGEGEWIIYPSNSEIMDMIAAAMLRAGWTIDEAEQAFADAPFGQYIYRNSKRTGTFGRAALDWCWQKAEAKWEREKIAAGQAIGPGWKIVLVTRKDLDDPEYELTFNLDDGRSFVSKMHIRDMTIDKQFVSGVAKSTGWAPNLQALHMGNGIMTLFRVICDMAGVVVVAKEATTGGFIETLIKAALVETEHHISPESQGLGWRVQGLICIRAGLLISRVRSQHYGATLGDVWAGAERLGAIVIHPKGMAEGEAVWALPEGLVK